MLWEQNFYCDGKSVAKRIAELVPQVDPNIVASIAIEARHEQHLRHVPLLVVREMIRHREHSKLVADTLEAVIERPDEICEFLSLYWDPTAKGDRRLSKSRSLDNQARRGLRRAFAKFDRYQLAKWQGSKNAIKLRDALRLVRPKPTAEQEEAFRELAANRLGPAETWESKRAAGKAAKETFEDLITSGKLPAMALLKNLRQMREGGVSSMLITRALAEMKAHKVLPFRFLTAAIHNPSLEVAIEDAMLRSARSTLYRSGVVGKLSGRTVIVVDVSGSMYGVRLSGGYTRVFKPPHVFLGRGGDSYVQGRVREALGSELDRAHAACALAMFLREVCEGVSIYATAGNDEARKHATAEIPARHGFALADAIYRQCGPLGGGGIFLNQAMNAIAKVEARNEVPPERVIVITDEQDCAIDRGDSATLAPLIGKSNYIINVAPEKVGIGYERWTKIDGFSENVIKFIGAFEGASFPTQ